MICSLRVIGTGTCAKPTVGIVQDLSWRFQILCSLLSPCRQHKVFFLAYPSRLPCGHGVGLCKIQLEPVETSECRSSKGAQQGKRMSWIFRHQCGARHQILYHDALRSKVESGFGRPRPIRHPCLTPPPPRRWPCPVMIRQVDVFQCTVDGDSLTCTCRYAADEDTAKAKKGFHDLEVRKRSEGYV